MSVATLKNRKAAKSRKPRRKIEDRNKFLQEFVETYNQANSLNEVAKKMDLSYGTVVQTAWQLRKQGFQGLKVFQKGSKKIPIDFNKLNSLPTAKSIIAKMRKQSV